MWERKGEKGIIRASSHNCLHRRLVLLRYHLPKKTAPLGSGGWMGLWAKYQRCWTQRNRLTLVQNAKRVPHMHHLLPPLSCSPEQMWTFFVGVSAMLLPPAEPGRSSWHSTRGNHRGTSEGSCRFKMYPWRDMSVGQRHQKT